MPTFQDYLREIANISDVDPAELTEEQSKAWYEIFDELKDGLADKIDAFAGFLRCEAAKAKALKEEAAYLGKRAKAIENKIEGLKTHYLSVMVQNSLTKVAGTTHTISIRNNKSVLVDADAVAELPDDFKKVTVEPRKTEIKRVLDAGGHIPGCSIVEQQSLNIR